ncbi:unnamed protein product [Rotaria magnacalcarata]|uniref:Uncharacterized protein n=1 Tax=Rotaria magnacalcarata TaxID=392030 RepID=A0A816NYX9_9BILA|nr:unnamed protein product [Rotaria magnacalcarata]CAF3738028.1 unnamed protein product [Rotaria magnacalcarata]
MATNNSRTITTEQARVQCHSIVLKLKSSSSSTNSRQDEPQRMLNALQKRVNDRFDILMRKLVIDEKEQMNDALLEKLKKVKHPDTFLEAFLTHLYGRAVKEEEDVVSPNVTDEEKREIDGLVEHVCTKQ